MGRESRDRETDRMLVLKSVQGHDNSVVHAFGHTNGHCPMCSAEGQFIMFCSPDEPNSPKLRGCELDGRHLHRVCSSCKYPFIERCLDQAMLAEERGEVPAESQLAAALALVAHRSGGILLDMAQVSSYRGWVIHFERDPERGTVTLTVTEPVPHKGGPLRHPSPQEAAPE